jgi:DNA-binding IclR family transcriptional regulator
MKKLTLKAQYEEEKSVLAAVRAGAMSLAEIARQTGIPKMRVHNALANLLDIGGLSAEQEKRFFPPLSPRERTRRDEQWVALIRILSNLA